MTAPLSLLLVALIAMLGFLSMRRIEEKRGARFLESQRTDLDARATVLWASMVQGGIPLSWRHFATALMHEMSHAVVRLAVELLRAVERPLARLSYRMRVSAPKSGSAPVSDFLRTITPEKK